MSSSQPSDERDQQLPPEVHQLVVAEPRQRGPEPDPDEREDRQLQEEPDRAPQPAGQDAEVGTGGAAEEQRGDDGAEGDRGHELGDVEEGEADRAVLGVEAGDQLLLGLGEVERRPVHLRGRGDEEDHERHHAGDDEVPVRAGSRGPGSACTSDHVVGRQRPRHEHDGDDGEAEGGLVADHLGRRPHRAEQRVLRARRPAGEHHAVHGDRRAARARGGCRAAASTSCRYVSWPSSATMPSLPSLKSPPKGTTENTRKAGTADR